MDKLACALAARRLHTQYAQIYTLMRRIAFGIARQHTSSYVPLPKPGIRFTSVCAAQIHSRTHSLAPTNNIGFAHGNALFLN